MPWYRVDDRFVHMLIRGKKAPHPCAAPHVWSQTKKLKTCMQIATYECDWKIGPDKRCDRPLCTDHALEVAPDKHLCPEHQEDYRKWNEARSQSKLTASPERSECAAASIHDESKQAR